MQLNIQIPSCFLLAGFLSRVSKRKIVTCVPAPERGEATSITSMFSRDQAIMQDCSSAFWYHLYCHALSASRGTRMGDELACRARDGRIPLSECLACSRCQSLSLDGAARSAPYTLSCSRSQATSDWFNHNSHATSDWFNPNTHATRDWFDSNTHAKSE